MPELILDLTPKTVARLQELVAEYNVDTDHTLTLEEWITLKLRELAIAKVLTKDADHERAQVDTNFKMALADKRLKRLEELG
jgi:hypothetical protein